MIDFNTVIKTKNTYISTPKQPFILNLTNIDINNNNNIYDNDKFILNIKINDSNDKLKLYNIEQEIKKRNVKPKDPNILFNGIQINPTGSIPYSEDMKDKLDAEYETETYSEWVDDWKYR